ncbi:Uncharacterised protein g10733 [Pycnogonum litorale]
MNNISIFEDEYSMWTTTTTVHENDSFMNRTDPETRPFALPIWKKLIWTLSFGFMVVVAVLGNVMVAWTILAHRRMRTVTNYFLLNLSVADFMMATLNGIFNFTFMVEGHWPFAALYCHVNNFMGNLTVSSSVFTLVAMCIDRYVAIIYPLRPRMSKKIAWIVIATIWLGASILSVPMLIYSTTDTFHFKDGTYRTVCWIVWPDGPSQVSLYDYRYNIVFLHLTYVIPISLMAFAYTKMGRTLWGSRGIGEHISAQSTNIRSKQRVVKMFIVVVALFAFCWLPYHFCFIYGHYDKTIFMYDAMQHLFLGFYMLAMSNTVYNPIIYYWMNPRFRQYFNTILKCRCSVTDHEFESRRQTNAVSSLTGKRTASKSALKRNCNVNKCRQKDINHSAASIESTVLPSSQIRNVPMNDKHLPVNNAETFL